MNPEQLRIVETVIEWAKSNHIDLTDTAFYTPEEWKARGEVHCTKSKLVMTYEGEINHVINGYTDDPMNYATLVATLDKLGYWFECGTSWYCGFYKN